MTTPPPKPITQRATGLLRSKPSPKKTNQKVLTALSPKVLEGRRTDRAMLTNQPNGHSPDERLIRAPLNQHRMGINREV
jgi:hypothetical protein